MTLIITGQNSVLGTDDCDVTVDTGSSANRKAILMGVAQDGAIAALSAVRDPGGSDEACTVVTGRELSVLNPTDAYYHLTPLWLDLGSNEGSQTFRLSYAGDSEKLGLIVAIEDGLAAGGPEADESTQFTTLGASISDSITSLSANAVLYTLAMMRTSTNESASPWFTADNGQTRYQDNIIDARVENVIGRLAKAVAGAQTLGWTGTNDAQCGAQVLLSFAPAAGGGGGLSIPVAQHHYAQQGEM